MIAYCAGQKDEQIPMGSRLYITLIGPAIGAEISGVNLAEALDDDIIAEIHAAWLRYQVVFFRDQNITPAQQLAFARRFAEIDRYPFVKGLDAYPEIIPVLKREHETVNFGGVWHSDTAYLEQPALGAILYAKELPPLGGDTLWANMYLAYERLSAGMQDLLDGLIAVNTSNKAAVNQTRAERIRDNGSAAESEVFTAEHPVVRTHPETGCKLLYVNRAHTVRFKDMSEAESAPLLNYLCEHLSRPEFCCRFRWSIGALAFWDNRCTQHYPLNDYHGYRRLLHRVSLKGDKPF